VKGRVSGWNATKAWSRVAWVSITVKDDYLLGIIRMVAEEVEWVELVTRVLIGLISLGEDRRKRVVSSGW